MMPGEDKDIRNESISAAEFLHELRQGKWLLIGITALCVGLAALYAFTATSWYRAEVLLKLADPKSVQGLSGQLGGLEGLAGLAGINLGSDNTAEPIAVLTSREFTGNFITSQNLLPVLFAKKWDASAKRWKSSRARDQLDVRDGIRYFDKTLRTVTEDRKTKLIRMTVDWTDAETAAAWANLLVERANEHMRQRALTEAQSKVNYLKQELATSNLVTIQQSIGRVLETELQKLMLANVNKEYAFRVIDHAQIPKWRNQPRRFLIVLASCFLGPVIATLSVFARLAFRRARTVRDSELTKGP
jgi:uncharacterized protein involved in exopolysaccharide biosynthesis